MGQTEKSRYPSRYSKGKFVTEAQYITEYICEIKARMDGKDLPEKFWELPDWKKYFGFQVTLCNRLLKKYQGRAILAALKSPQGARTYSLNAPHLIKLILKEEAILAQSNRKPVEDLKVAKANCAGRKSVSKSKLDKLDE